MRILDLFCGAGGAAMGYHRAFPDAEIVGVDINPQPRYPFTFVQADALTFPLEGFDLIHASPPCQRYSIAAKIHDSSDRHPDLVDPMRERLVASGVPYVIENVPGAPLRTPIVLCGSMFCLGVRRHRLFESSFFTLAPRCGSHDLWYASVFGGRCIGRQRVTGADSGSGRRTQTWGKFAHELAVASAAMGGIDWMTLAELSDAIPPAYTQFIGEQFAAHLSERAA